MVDELIGMGWPEPIAVQYVGRVGQSLDELAKTPEARQAARGAYLRHIFFGALWAGGGGAVTLATYSAAEPGGTFIVASGAIAFGVLESLYGLFGWVTNR